MFFFFFGKPYITIIGELIDNDRYDKTDAARRLESVLQSINNQYEDNITAKFMPTINNEFQGLVCKGANLMSILLEIKNKMHPVKIRFGVGIGEIDEDSLSYMSISAKGPGCEKAREALNYLRIADGRKQMAIADVRIEAAGEYEERLRLVNTILSLLTTLEYSWSDRQREIIYNMMKYKEKQAGVAKRLGITQSTVQKSLTAGRYYTYEEALKTVESVFKELDEL